MAVLKYDMIYVSFWTDSTWLSNHCNSCKRKVFLAKFRDDPSGTPMGGSWIGGGHPTTGAYDGVHTSTLPGMITKLKPSKQTGPVPGTCPSAYPYRNQFKGQEGKSCF